MPTSQFSGPLHTFGFSTQQVSTPIPGARRPTCAAPCGRHHPLSHCNQRHTARFDVVSSSVNIPWLASALRDHPACSFSQFSFVWLLTVLILDTRGLSLLVLTRIYSQFVFTTRGSHGWHV